LNKQTEYIPNQRNNLNIIQTWKTVIFNIIHHWDLVKELVRVDLLGQFKKSFIGASWLIIFPLLNVVIWLLLNMAGVFNPGDTGIPYPAYVLLSTSIWTFFFGFYDTISRSLTQGGQVFIQTKFPHEVIFVQKIIVHLINFSIPFILILIVLMLFGIQFYWTSLLFPLVILPIIFLGASIGLVFSLFDIVAMDINSLFNKVMSMLIYITPIVYSDKVDSSVLQSIINYNPLTYILGSARDILIKGSLYQPEKYFLCAGISLVIFIICVRLFYVAEAKVMERITL
jgi:lipopolysaccharide transport system permease protein